MIYNPDIHHRRSIRLKGKDYTQSGWYFITICTHNRECLFGEIKNKNMILNTIGHMVREEWMKTADIRPMIKLDAFVIMPNHIHGIIVLSHHGRGTACRALMDAARYPAVINDESRHAVDKGTARRAPTNVTQTIEKFGKPVSNSIPTIVRAYKSAATKRINEKRGTPGFPVWQRNYYEHIIRDENDYNRIFEYIQNNPACWEEDKLFVEHGTNCERNV